MAQNRTFYKGRYGALSQQFEAWVKNGPLQRLSPKNMQQAVDQVAQQAPGIFLAAQEYMNVTGNTYRSFYAGTYYKGKLVTSQTTSGEDPTRKTLRKGEVYNLPEYYGGVPVKGARYKGDYGRGGQWGPTLGLTALRQSHPPLRHTYALECVLPLDYAGYNEAIVSSYEQTKDAVAELFASMMRNIVMRSNDVRRSYSAVQTAPEDWLPI